MHCVPDQVADASHSTTSRENTAAQTVLGEKTDPETTGTPVVAMIMKDGTKTKRPTLQTTRLYNLGTSVKQDPRAA